MASKQNLQPESGAEIFVPLNKLKPSPRNVRKVPHGPAEIEALAASIAAKGLLQNLVVEPERDGEGSDTGHYLVTIGEGRRLAQLLRAKRKQIKKTEPIRCMLDTEHDAVEISLAENVVRSQMHPADEYEAFAWLHNTRGMAADDIAARFGVTPAVVRQRLKLGAVSPVLMKLYREGEATLEQLMAFAITDDHARQEEVWASLGYDDSAYAIRRALTEGQVKSDDRRARFVGVEEYVAAGGTVIRDLFDGNDGGYFTDAALLDGLVLQKLEREGESIRTEGWGWVSVAIEFDHGLISRMRRLYPEAPEIADEAQQQIDRLSMEYDELSAEAESLEMTDELEARLAELEARIEALKGEPVFEPADIKRGGAYVSLGYDGHLRIERGFIKAEDEPEVASADETADNAEGKRVPGVSEKLMQALTAQRTAALRETLAGKPEVAFIAVVHAFVGSVFYNTSQPSCLQITARTVYLSREAPGIDESADGRACDERQKALAALLPEDPNHLWDALLEMPHAQLMALLAHCAANCVDWIARPGSTSSAAIEHAQKLAQSVSLDMRLHWQPSVANYLGHVTKPVILDAVREAASDQAAARIADLKKATMAEAAEKLLANSGWLPHPLRMPAAQTTVPLAAE